MDHKGNILVIDDELGIREGCRRVLEPEGYIVDTASTMREGLSKIRQNSYDIILLDVMMPDGRGIDLLEPIQAKDPDTVALIITGYATVELAVKAIKEGAYDFISKPFTAEVLLLTVEQGLEKRQLSLEAKRLQEIEQQAAELTRKKEEAERLSEFKTAFTYTVAHELRSPMGGALSLLRTLTRGMAGELNEEQRDILTRIETRLNQLLDMINDLLTLAASRSIEQEEPLERIPLQSVIKQLIEHYQPEAQGKGIEFIFSSLPVASTGEDGTQVWATQDGLRKIFGNLIGNAIKYTPTGGKVRVEVFHPQQRELATQDMSGLLGQKTVRTTVVGVRVSDSGIGIPEQDLPNLFEDFFRARNAKSAGILGTGLGLSIVKQYADRFGASIEVQSQEGEGTTFTVHFPIDI